jgi:heme oxygenase
MFSEEMKEGTRQVHLNLEKKLVDQIRRVNTVEDYVQLLERMYGYYHPLQQRIEQNMSGNEAGKRARQALNIINDIKELDPDHPLEFRLCNNLPAIDSPAASMGALYVTEGSTLGGKIITKMIARQLNISTQKGFSFFNPYGEDTQKMWEDFKSLLNHPHAQDEKAEMLDTARHTFEKFNEWIDLYE